MDTFDFVQIVAIIICIVLAIFGSVFAFIGAWREAYPNPEPGKGIVLIVIGTIALGFSGIAISVAAKLLH